MPVPVDQRVVGTRGVGRLTEGQRHRNSPQTSNGKPGASEIVAADGSPQKVTVRTQRRDPGAETDKEVGVSASDSKSDPSAGTEPSAGAMVVAHFIVSSDVERSRRFYTDVLGGKTVISGEQGDEVTYVALANSWVIINVGGGPTDDKPGVTLETPSDADRVSSFLNIRVADIRAVYDEWSARGAQFLTPPKQHETELRCYLRDPDGYLIEVGQTTLARGWRPPS